MMLDFVYVFGSKKRAWEFLTSPEPFIITYPKQITKLSQESLIYLGCLNYWGKKRDDKSPIIFGRGPVCHILTNYPEKLPAHLQQLAIVPEYVMVENVGKSIRLYFQKDATAIMDSTLLERNDKFSLIFPLARLLNWPRKDHVNKFIPFDGERMVEKLFNASKIGGYKVVPFQSNFKVPKYKLKAENL